MSDQTVTEQAEQSEVTPDPVIARVQERFGDQILEASVERDQPTFVVDRETLLDLMAFLRDDPELRFTRLSDLCGIDNLNLTPELPRRARFEAVYHVHSLSLDRWVRVRVPVTEEDTEVPSLIGLWAGANWLEREAYDLVGIRFTNHPNLTRILTPDDWEGHPLRKDFQPPKEPHEWSFNPEQWQKAVQRGN